MSAIPLAENNPALEKLIDKVDDLAVLPHVVFKVLEITGDSDSPAHEMEKAITVDPGFSSKVLVLANSAYFGLPRRVTSIKEALLFLGYRSVRNLAMTVGAFDLFVGKTDGESLRRRTWWRHSVDTAVCCRWIATKTGKTSADDAYTCGLLHYIGKTLLDRFGEEDYMRVSVLVEGGSSDVKAEKEIYGCDHVEVAYAAGVKWGFPETLLAGLLYREESSSSDLDSLRACTALGSHIAFVATQGADAHEFPNWVLAPLGKTEADIESLVSGGTEAISAAQLHL